MKISWDNILISERGYYLFIAFIEMAMIGLGLGFMGTILFGGGFNTYAIAYIVWILLLGFTPLINSFLIVVPENSGAVISNTFRTYGQNPDSTKLIETDALREVGPGLQGILLWERVGWVIDLGKQIVLEKPITTPSKDEILLTIEWQVILTPLQGKLANLVRHDNGTVTKYFDGLFRAKIIELVSKERAQSLSSQDGRRETKSIYENRNSLKRKFQTFLGGPEGIHEIEEQFGTFTNDPQLISFRRSDDFQKSVESLAINQNNAKAIASLVAQKLTHKQALIAVLTAQGKQTDGLIDVSATIEGLENLQSVSIGGMGSFGKRKSGKKDNE